MKEHQQTIIFREKKKYECLGRNGVLYCNGYNFMMLNGYVHVTPIDSRGHLGRAWMQIPNEHINEFCTKLQGNAVEKILDRLDKTQLPLLMGIDPICDELINKRIKQEDPDA